LAKKSDLDPWGMIQLHRLVAEDFQAGYQDLCNLLPIADAASAMGVKYRWSISLTVNSLFGLVIGVDVFVYDTPGDALGTQEVVLRARDDKRGAALLDLHTRIRQSRMSARKGKAEHEPRQ
jgi:hypothetical protein